VSECTVKHQWKLEWELDFPLFILTVRMITKCIFLDSLIWKHCRSSQLCLVIECEVVDTTCNIVQPLLYHVCSMVFILRCSPTHTPIKYRWLNKKSKPNNTRMSYLPPERWCVKEHYRTCMPTMDTANFTYIVGSWIVSLDWQLWILNIVISKTQNRLIFIYVPTFARKGTLA